MRGGKKCSAHALYGRYPAGSGFLQPWLRALQAEYQATLPVIVVSHPLLWWDKLEALARLLARAAAMVGAGDAAALEQRLLQPEFKQRLRASGFGELMITPELEAKMREDGVDPEDREAALLWARHEQAVRAGKASMDKLHREGRITEHQRNAGKASAAARSEEVQKAYGRVGGTKASVQLRDALAAEFERRATELAAFHPLTQEVLKIAAANLPIKLNRGRSEAERKADRVAGIAAVAAALEVGPRLDQLVVGLHVGNRSRFTLDGVAMELYVPKKPRQELTLARRALVLHLVSELQLPNPAAAHVVTDWRALAGRDDVMEARERVLASDQKKNVCSAKAIAEQRSNGKKRAAAQEREGATGGRLKRRRKTTAAAAAATKKRAASAARKSRHQPRRKAWREEETDDEEGLEAFACDDDESEGPSASETEEEEEDGDE